MMNNMILAQCKKAILTNRTTNKENRLSIYEKQKLKKLTKTIRKNNNLNNITFEDFVLLYKSTNLDVMLTIKTVYKTKLISLSQFNNETLKIILLKSIGEILRNGDYGDYDIELGSVYNNISDRNFILFEEFEMWCEKLNITLKVD